MRPRSLPALVIAVLLASGCAPVMSQQDLLQRLARGEAPVLLDVRTEKEFRAGHVPGAVNASILEFKQRFGALGLQKEREIVVICEHGPRASFAGFLLTSAGYGRVFNLDGAMKEWRKSGLPLEH